MLLASLAPRPSWALPLVPLLSQSAAGCALAFGQTGSEQRAGLGGAPSPAHRSSPTRQASSSSAPPSPSPGPESSPQASTSSSTSGATAPAAPNHQNKPRPVFAACILERLPVVMPKPDDWEVEYETWLTRRNLSQGLLKEYPRQAKQEAADKRMAEEEQKQFNPVPLVTKADASGDLRTMKRRLDQRLYLMVRRKVEGGREAWRFPQAQHQPGETLSATSERAIQDTVGRNYPIFHIGHAPLGWLPLWTAQGGKLFFQLAQVVDDPWPLSKMPAGVLDWGWVTKAEAQDKVEDARLSELLGRML